MNVQGFCFSRCLSSYPSNFLEIVFLPLGISRRVKEKTNDGEKRHRETDHQSNSLTNVKT